MSLKAYIKFWIFILISILGYYVFVVVMMHLYISDTSYYSTTKIKWKTNSIDTPIVSVKVGDTYYRKSWFFNNSRMDFMMTIINHTQQPICIHPTQFNVYKKFKNGTTSYGVIYQSRLFFHENPEYVWRSRAVIVQAQHKRILHAFHDISQNLEEIVSFHIELI